MSEVRPTLGDHAESLIASTLDERERSIINAVVARISAGSIEHEYAVQQWIALAEGRRLRSALIRKAAAEKSRYAKLIDTP